MLTSYNKKRTKNDNNFMSNESFFTDDKLIDNSQGRGKDLLKQDMDSVESNLDTIVTKLSSLSSWSKQFADEHTQTLAMFLQFFDTNFTNGVEDFASTCLIELDKLIDNSSNRSLSHIKIPTDAFLGTITNTAKLRDDYIEAITDLDKFVNRLSEMFDVFENKADNGCLIDIVTEILTDDDMSKNRYDLLYETLVSKKDENNDDISLLSKIETVVDLSNLLHKLIDKGFGEDLNISGTKEYDMISVDDSDDKYLKLRDSVRSFSDKTVVKIISLLGNTLTKIYNQVSKFDEINVILSPLHTVKTDKLTDSQITLFNAYAKVVVSYCDMYEKFSSFVYGLFELFTAYITYLKTNFGKPKPLAGI